MKSPTRFTQHFANLTSGFVLAVSLLFYSFTNAQNVPASSTDIKTSPRYGIDLTNPDLTVESGQFKMGGKNPQGIEINANSRYLTLGGKPWFPVLGEFHFARYPHEQWEE